MGLLSRIVRRAAPARAAGGGKDPLLTREYWEDAAAAAPVERTVDAICDGYTCEQFKSGSGVHFDESELGADAVVLDLACGMGRTCRRVAGLVREYHGVDFAAGMVERAREHNRGVPSATFHVNDGATLGGFADGTFDGYRRFLLLPRPLRVPAARAAYGALVAWSSMSTWTPHSWRGYRRAMRHAEHPAVVAAASMGGREWGHSGAEHLGGCPCPAAVRTGAPVERDGTRAGHALGGRIPSRGGGCQ